MINKFKDFLKSKLTRKKSSDLSDQDDISDEQPSIVEPEVKFEATEESTGEVSLVEPKLSLKDKLSNSFKKLKSKLPEGKLKNLKLPQNLSANLSQGSPLLSPNISKHIEQFLSRSFREPIHQVALVVIVCGMTYTFGKITALVLKGTPIIDSAKSKSVVISLEKDFNPITLNQVKSINVFRTNTGLNKKKSLADTKCEEAEQTTALPLKLVNTIVLQDTIKSIASVQVRGGRELREVREGDQIDNLAKIFKITRLELLIKNLESGVCESVISIKARDVKSNMNVLSPDASKDFKANKKMSGIENVGNKFKIQKSLLDEKLKDIASLLTQARAIKIQNPDGSLSFKMTEMDPAGIFPYLGLQDQDIITSLNGKPIYDLNEVMSLFSRIKNLDQLSLGIKREGMDAVQEYSIKK